MALYSLCATAAETVELGPRPKNCTLFGVNEGKFADTNKHDHTHQHFCDAAAVVVAATGFAQAASQARRYFYTKACNVIHSRHHSLQSASHPPGPLMSRALTAGKTPTPTTILA